MASPKRPKVGKPHLERDSQKWVYDWVIKETGKVFHFQSDGRGRLPRSVRSHDMISKHMGLSASRLERLAKEQARRGPIGVQEQALLQKLQAHLNDNQPLRTLTLDAQEQKLLSGAPLLTRKPLLVIANVDEGQLTDTRLVQELQARTAGQGVHVVHVSAKIEEELAQLDDPSEREAFLNDLGIAESAIDRLTRVSYEALGLISYFTVGTDEVRAWTVRHGACAPEAGGVIHSDIERGFIRAEHMGYEDLIALGSEQAVASAGKASLKGKEYVVQDGDILNFRFNV